MMLPYFHDGVPHDQTHWIDELAVGTKRIGAIQPSKSSEPPVSNESEEKRKQQT